MTKNLKTILAVVSAILVLALVCGFLAHALVKREPENSGATDIPVQTAGKVYDGEGKELESGETYAMPTSMVFSTLYSEPLASQLKLAPASVNVTVSHNFPLNNIKIDWAALYADGTDASSAIKVTPTADGSTTAKVECLTAFSQPITLKASLRGDSENKATCSIDYVKRFTGFENFGMCGNDFDDSAGVDFYANFSQGTVMPDMYLDYITFYLKDDFTEAVKSYLTFDIEFTSYSIRNLKGSISEYNGKQLVTCEPGGGYSWAGFINGFNNLDDAHKNAIYYAWFHAWNDRSGADKYSTMTVDTSVSGMYKGNSFGNVTETDYIGGSIYSFYLSGEQYGLDLTPSLSLNTSIAF